MGKKTVVKIKPRLICTLVGNINDGEGENQLIIRSKQHVSHD